MVYDLYEIKNNNKSFLFQLCDVISKWETALREKGSGKFENSRVIRLTYRNRLYFKNSLRTETDKERLLLCYQINQQGWFKTISKIKKKTFKKLNIKIK